MGPELGLVAGVRAFRIHCSCRVSASGISVQVHFQEGIAGAERPLICYFPGYVSLSTLSRSIHFVAQQ
jgi:hypothetical protein